MKSELVKEVWKPVPGCEGYEVSSFGRGRSLNYNHTGKPKILKLQLTPDGYCFCRLSKGGKVKTFRVNRLVWEAFNGPIPDGMQVNHINELKTDNSVWNLNLMSPKENQNYGICIRKRVEKQSKPVYQYTLDGVLVCVWASVNEAGRNGFSRGCISECCNGKRKSYKGFLWSYTPLN